MVALRRQYEIREASFTPTAVGADETIPLIDVIAGERVIALSVKVATCAAINASSTIEIGDGDDTDGFLAATSTKQNLMGTLIDGQGAYFTKSGGKLYRNADVIDAKYRYVTTTTGDKPVWTVRALVTRDWP